MDAGDALGDVSEAKKKVPRRGRKRQRQPIPFGDRQFADAIDAGQFNGVSEATWWRHHAAGLIPTPVKLGKRTLWYVQELKDWGAAGCPPRKEWEAMKAARIPGGQEAEAAGVVGRNGHH
jgi:predicted DNA-binding transcriptional regulator AlpA